MIIKCPSNAFARRRSGDAFEAPILVCFAPSLCRMLPRTVNLLLLVHLCIFVPSSRLDCPSSPFPLPDPAECTERLNEKYISFLIDLINVQVTWSGPEPNLTRAKLQTYFFLCVLLIFLLYFPERSCYTQKKATQQGVKPPIPTPHRGQTSYSDFPYVVAFVRIPFMADFIAFFFLADFMADFAFAFAFDFPLPVAFAFGNLKSFVVRVGAGTFSIKTG